jgi:hypothetical protein
MRMPVLLLLVLVAGTGTWLLVRDGGEGEPAAPPGGDPPREAGPAAPPAGSEPPAPPPALPTGDGPDADPVPRILPPDAALEDIRDALTAEDEAARGPALQAAFVSTTRVADSRTSILREFHRRIEREEDARVRGVATAAMGSSSAEENRRWLHGMLTSGVAKEDRLGALVALARPTKATRRDAISEARAPALGGLAYDYTALPEDEDLLIALASFLDSTESEGTSDALPILLRSVERSAMHATLLAADGKNACRWYLSLAAGDRARVRAAALAHRNLLPEVRSAIEAK